MSSNFAFYSSNDYESSTILIPHHHHPQSEKELLQNYNNTHNNHKNYSSSIPIYSYYDKPCQNVNSSNPKRVTTNTNTTNKREYHFTIHTPSSSSSTSSSPSRSQDTLSVSENSNLLPIPPPSIQLRFLNPQDYETVKGLCEEWFPVDYPASWYDAITSDSNFFSLAAVVDQQIIGLIVAELKDGTSDLGVEDRDLLCNSHSKFNIGYILSLGVVDGYRRQGIASLLLSSLLDHLSSVQCKAVYLHVLSTNKTALRFYEKHRFRVHKFLPYYYYIGGKCRDGFTYVLYLNGGHGPWGLFEYVQHFCSILSQEASQVPNWCMKQFRRVAHSIVTYAR